MSDRSLANLERASGSGRSAPCQESHPFLCIVRSPVAPRGAETPKRAMKVKANSEGFVTRHKISLLMEFLYFWLRSFQGYKRRGHPETALMASRCVRLFELLLGLPIPPHPIKRPAFHLQRIPAGCKLSVTTNPCFSLLKGRKKQCRHDDTSSVVHVGARSISFSAILEAER